MPGRMAEHFDVAFGRVQQSQQKLYSRRFSRTVRPEQTEYFTPAHLEIDVVNCARFWPPPEIFEDFGEAANGDDDLAV